MTLVSWKFSEYYNSIIKDNSIERWVKDLNRHVSKEYNQRSISKSTEYISEMQVFISKYHQWGVRLQTRHSPSQSISFFISHTFLALNFHFQIWECASNEEKGNPESSTLNQKESLQLSRFQEHSMCYIKIWQMLIYDGLFFFFHIKGTLLIWVTLFNPLPANSLL